MLVADVMAHRVISVRPDTWVAEAVRLMLQNDISGLPVIDADGVLVGIVTEGDFLRRTEIGTERRRPHWLEFVVGAGRLAEDYVHSHGRTVAEVMTRDVVTVTEETPLDDAVELMERRHVKRLPVVRGERVVGIVSRANLLHALARLASEAKPRTSDDAAIRDQLLAEVDKQPWAPRASINVVVRDGIVDLWGVVLDNRERQALVVAAENVPGVKQVRDHLAWLEPYTGYVMEAEEVAAAEVSAERRQGAPARP